jgi:tRNA(fMet)-specific endonuclease VapC
MNGSVIDTNVIIKVLASDASADNLLDSLGDTYIPVIVVGELYYGARNSSRQKENLRTFTEFISQYEILDIDRETAASYAEIKHSLKRMGTIFPRTIYG